jgi:hypothetical protein
MVPSWIEELGREVEVELKRLSDEEVVKKHAEQPPRLP